METAETKIWVIALFMLISFVFNWLKKKRGDKEEIESDGAWGINDIIRKFEEDFDGRKSEQHMDSRVVFEEDSVKNIVPERDYANESHSAFEHIKKNRVNTVADLEEEVEAEYDLEQIIIHNTILNRPKY